MKVKKTLISINLYLGSNRNITGKDLINEVIKGLSQIKLGLCKKVEYIDNKVNKLTIEQFLA